MRSFIKFPTPLRALTVFILVCLSAFTGCIQDEVSPSQPVVVSGVSADTDNPNAKSASYAGDYNISVSVDGKIWTYCITKNKGAKDLSNFSINLQNCGPVSATINNILWATVNGKPATLQNSNGKNGCDIQSVTTNFVKFDGLPAASSYKIVFKVNRLFGNFIPTTVWLKAGTSCHPYTIVAPCCPL
jgi:hypothetical protein